MFILLIITKIVRKEYNSNFLYLCSMDIVDFCDFCDSLPAAEQTMPFDDTTIAYKVSGRMFACIGMDAPDHFAVKCDPDRAIMLRDRTDSVRGAYHFNKRHWNDIFFNGDLTDDELKREIIHSYMLVVRQNVTPKALREELLRALLSEQAKYFE